ncbi:cytochrome P450 85A-like [Hibiscus syriacus]|uniref:Cytochrome P450 85A-like n=1 Tax=Hibiscus syriacus TaxID=106335 RepID=A0A6A3ADQ5_HIBSY|nr:cytochrome P450 85A-like [Hibiscus syriacus]
MGRWMKPEVYPLVGAMAFVTSMCVFQLTRNVFLNPAVRSSPEVNTVAPNSVHPKPEWTAGGIALLIGKHSGRTHRENYRKHFCK